MRRNDIVIEYPQMARVRETPLILLLLALIPTASRLVAQTVAEIVQELKTDSTVESPFACTGTVGFLVTPDLWYFTVADASGSIIVNVNQSKTPAPVRPGDIVALSGIIRRHRDDNKEILSSPFCEKIAILGHEPPPPAPVTPIGELLDGLHPNRPVLVRGCWEDLFIDEIDPNWIYGILSDGHDRIFVTLERRWANFEDFASLVGATVEIEGVCRTDRRTGRHQFGHFLVTVGLGNVKVLMPPPKDPYAVPDISVLRQLRPDRLSSLPRHRTTGRIIATWDSSLALLRTADESIVDIRFADEAPPIGSIVDVIGFPSTDFFRVNLSRAEFRTSKAPPPPAERPAEETSLSDLTTDGKGHVQFKPTFHGQTVRIRGLVRSRTTSSPDAGTLTLECDNGRLLHVNASTCPQALRKADIGATVSVTGVCVMKTESDRPNVMIPRIRDLMLVLRSPDDITVLVRPPWWTPARTFLVLAVLLTALTGVFIWNRQLHSLAERRGKELASEHLARAETDMKVMERTRLAVELHDTIAQNLTGVAFEIDTATRIGTQAPSEMCRHLAVASRTLESCRSELRDCLWDLRCNALEESDMDAAIRQTLLPYVDNVDVSVRFNVPREIFSENTVHAVLCIVRELVVNAIRHGCATHVWIAGSIEHGDLLFSVRDNGTGFDPANAPDVLEGHFGLNGIRERLKTFSGHLKIERMTQSGMKLTADIRLPRTESGSS